MGFTEADRPLTSFDVTIELLLHGYGDAVDVEAPPESRVMTSLEAYEYERRWYEGRNGSLDPAP